MTSPRTLTRHNVAPTWLRSAGLDRTHSKPPLRSSETVLLKTAWPAGSCCRLLREMPPMTRLMIAVQALYGAGIGEVEHHIAHVCTRRCERRGAWSSHRASCQCGRVAGEPGAMPITRRIQADMGRSGARACSMVASARSSCPVVRAASLASRWASCASRPVSSQPWPIDIQCSAASAACMAKPGCLTKLKFRAFT